MINVSQDRGRITARVPRSVEDALQEAAELSGATINQFVVQAALEKAKSIIDRERIIKLSANDAALLITMLDQLSKPNLALTQAFERFKNKDNNEQSPGSIKQESRPK
jgi:uncharacterized protein (DUF1778 family)